MSRQKGQKFFKETLAYRNANPLNIRYAGHKWQGAKGQEGGFVKFGAFSYGYRAAVRIFRTYWVKGLRTLEDYITRWAPPEENDTERYIENVIEMIGERTSEPYVVDKDTRIDLANRELIVQLLLAMTRVEMGANSAQAHSLRPYAEMGYDLAATDPEFFKK